MWVDGGLRLQAIGYQDVSSYVNVAEGSRYVQIAATGSNPPTVFWAGNFSVYANSASTVAAAGLVPYLDVLVYADNRTADSTRAKVRFIHLSPETPSVDVDLVGSPASFSSTPYLLATNYVAFTAGSYDLLIEQAGTGTIVLYNPDLTFVAQENYTMFLTSSHDDSVDVVVVQDTD